MEYAWLLFALLSALTAALVAIFGKIGLQGIEPNTATAVRAIIMAVFLVVIVGIQSRFTHLGTIFSSSKALTFIILSGIAGALSWLFYFLALKLGKVSQVAPIDRLSVVFAIVFALVFLGEKMSWKGATGAVLLTAGAILIAIG